MNGETNVKKCFITGSLILSCLAYGEKLKPDPAFMKVVQECKMAAGIKSKSDQHVYMIKQVHYMSVDHTHDPKKTYIQDKNLFSIYKQVSSWIERKKVKTLVAEACNEETTLSNIRPGHGWDLKELIAMKDSKKYENVRIDVSDKLELKYSDRIRTLCGDSYQLIDENMGAYRKLVPVAKLFDRLVEGADDPAKMKVISKDIINLYPDLKTAKENELAKKVILELRKTLKDYLNAMEKRNDYLMEVIQGVKDPSPVVIFGGMHAPGLIKRMESKGIACTVLQPVGYPENIETDFAEAEKALHEMKVE